jgi:photosystem II stability/assembly factor-like uncharacterized protein
VGLALRVLGVVLFGALALEAQPLDSSLLNGLEWRAIGPAVMGGRIDDVAVVEARPSVIYVGSASGGLWKTVNRGTTWQPIFDDQPVSSIGDIALAPSNPEIVWVGTGEPNNRQSSSFGNGVYRSSDGGRSWQHRGLADTHHIGRVVVDPKDPDTVFVAALGHLWGPNRERGVFKTTDGGRTWANVLFIDEDTGVSDLAMDPADAQVLYAAAYQRRRTAWGFNGGGVHGGIHKTTDGGKTWKKLSAGLPSGRIGRIGLDVYRKNPAIVYAIVEHREGGIFRSDDRGLSWTKLSSLNPRPMYYSQIRVDPTNDQRVYVLGAPFYVSNDGGRTFADPVSGRPGANTAMTPRYDVGVHGDHHALWINPADPEHLVLGGDGGLYFSYDGSRSWDKVNNLPLAQFYAIGFDMQKPYFIYGGLQDTHSFGGPSATRHHIGILNSDWFQIDFGDGMYARVDPSDASTVYIESQNGNLVRLHPATGDRKNIKPHPKPGEPPYRFNWTAPIEISPHDPRTIYLGGNRVFRSNDRGETWTASVDLTKAEDRDKFEIMSELPSRDWLSRHDGVAAWGTITSLVESPVRAGVLWAGTDDGNIQLSRDAGTTWTNLASRVPGLPSGAWVSRVEASRRDAASAYVSFDRHWWDDFKPYIYLTTDFGQTWKPITKGLDPVGWVNVVKEHPRNADLLFAGTETGLYVSIDRGAHWTRFRGNLPTVPVDDVAIHPRDNDVILGTHGRGIYVLDDVAALSDLRPDVLARDLHLFVPRSATLMQLRKDESYSAQRVFAGPNPPRGALLSYHLRQPAGDLKLSVLGDDGKLVRELSGPKEAGIHRIVWDLRHAGPRGVAAARGPFVLPGRYTVKLAAGGREATAGLVVEADPLMPLADAERKERLRFLVELNQLQSTLQAASDGVAALLAQLTPLVGRLTAAKDAPAPVVSAATAAVERARQLQQKLAGRGGGEAEEGGFSGPALRGRLSALFGEIDGDQPTGVRPGTLTGPTAVQKERLAQLREEVSDGDAQAKELAGRTLSGLNELLGRHNLPTLAATPSAPVSR